MKIEKATWTTDRTSVRLNMPLSKVDTEKRLVSGFATLDNTDTQGDVVEAAASTKAFARFRGNIREMHQPKAVGRLVEFKEDTFFDPKTEKFYSGIYATAYVSKGAQDTWEKVLDGTLTGFSIGGNILDADNEFDKAAGRTVRFVKDYELVELSLVDSPANQLANVFSIEKAADGTITSVSGFVSEVKINNVYWCPNCEIAKSSVEDGATCPNCGGEMNNVGWFELDESDDPAIRAQKVAEVIKESFSKATVVGNSDTIEGGANVADTNEEGVEKVITSEDVTPQEENEGGSDKAVEETPAAEETEKAADVSEVEVEEPDFEKMLEGVRAEVTSALGQSEEALTKALAGVESKIAELTETFTSQISELSSKHGELSEKFSGLNSQLAGVEKRVDSVVDETAVKKSGDLGGSKEDSLVKSKESKWGGKFFSVDSL
jgi:hypothetical protein